VGGFSVSIDHEEGCPVLTLRGDLDLASAAQLKHVLVQFSEPSVIIDLSDLAFIDSAGLAALISAQSANGGGRRIVVRGPLQRGVRRVFEVTGLLSMLDNEGEAGQQLSGD
jgi:anti-anti-sigma factor